MTVKHEIALDVARSGVQCTVSLTQHDTGVHRLIFRIRNGGNPLELSERTVAVMFLEGDIYESCTCYVGSEGQGGIITCDVSPAVTARVGLFKAVLQIFDGADTLLYSPQIAFSVSKDITGGTQVLESVPYSAVVKAQLEAEAHAADAQGAAALANSSAEQARSAAESAIDALDVSNTRYASIIKGVRSGTPIVTVDDVSPFSHEMKVRVSGFDDHTTLHLYSLGKNLLRFDDGTYTIPVGATGRKMTVNVSSSHVKIDFEPNTWMNQSEWISRVKPACSFFLPAGAYRFQALNVSRMDKTTCMINLCEKETDTSIVKFQAAIQNSENAYVEFATTFGQQVYLYMYIDNSNMNDASFEADLMLWSREADGTFMPYVPPVVHAVEADGTVRGVRSVFPGTALYTDDPNDSSTVTCEYFRDTGKVVDKLTAAIRRLGGTV